MIDDNTLNGWGEDAEHYLNRSAPTNYNHPSHSEIRHRILALIKDVRDLKAQMERQHYRDMRLLEDIADRHGWCLPGGMSTEACSRSVCDCFYEGVFEDRDFYKARTADLERSLEALRAKTGICEGDGEANCYCKR